jgi:hypothetical protein
MGRLLLVGRLAVRDLRRRRAETATVDGFSHVLVVKTE